MNMLPGDTKALKPSGLRLGVQELTRVGMGQHEMEDIAVLYRRLLIDGEEPSVVKKSVEELKSDFQIVRYCFNSDQRSGYPEM